ncbi:MAG: hypothetical protein HKM23_08740 [Nitrosopumilus sp.]|nr:hypothetical protein [Nitrosopumilus sp.]NNL58672.1 hypothetical protein [Nitrosopumilus sp.]
MTDPLLDDVKALLDKDFGDDRILKQIRRACENNEVISNYERNYVKQLAEKHLGKKPDVKASAEEKPIVPDVVMPEIQSVHQNQTYQPKPQPKYSSNAKNTKLFLGIGGIALVIIIAVAVSFSGISETAPTKTQTPTNTEPESLSVQTDLSSYSKKDLISISGISDTSRTVNLLIQNTKNELVWSEQVSVKSDGRFSTLAIAGGTGWENSGIYTLKVDNGKETKTSTFSFSN